MRRLDGFLYEAEKNFEIFSQVQDQNKKIKNLYRIAVDVLFYGHPVIPHSCTSNFAGRYRGTLNGEVEKEYFLTFFLNDSIDKIRYVLQRKAYKK